MTLDIDFNRPFHCGKDKSILIYLTTYDGDYSQGTICVLLRYEGFWVDLPTRNEWHVRKNIEKHNFEYYTWDEIKQQAQAEGWEGSFEELPKLEAHSHEIQVCPEEKHE